MKPITISVSDALLTKIDSAASEEFATRSEFIRSAIVERLKTIAEFHARLQSVVQRADPPTEDEILRLLKLKKTKLYVRQLQSEIRKYPSTD